MSVLNEKNIEIEKKKVKKKLSKELEKIEDELLKLKNRQQNIG